MTNSPKLIIFDVGHGSCVFLKDGAVTTVVDCKDSTLFIEYLLSQKISAISQIVISHADADHIAGVLALIQTDYIKIGTVFVNPDASQDSAMWMALRIALQDAHARGKLNVRTAIGDGMADQLQHEALRIEVLAPGIEWRLAGPGGKTKSGAAATSNAMSVVLLIHHENHPVVLLPGDMDAGGLTDLIARGKILACDMLVFPHHGGHIGGSGTPAARAKANVAFAKGIIEQTKPQLVIFSIGRGLFATPRPEIIHQIKVQLGGCGIFCTQLSEHCHAGSLAGAPIHLSLLPALGRAANQCCGGSLEITFAGSKTMQGLDRKRHTEFVKGALKSPLCRP